MDVLLRPTNPISLHVFGVPQPALFPRGEPGGTPCQQPRTFFVMKKKQCGFSPPGVCEHQQHKRVRLACHSSSLLVYRRMQEQGSRMLQRPRRSCVKRFLLVANVPTSPWHHETAVSHRRRDDLPQPEGPKMRTDCPLFTSKDSFRQIACFLSGVKSVKSSLDVSPTKQQQQHGDGGQRQRWQGHYHHRSPSPMASTAVAGATTRRRWSQLTKPVE